MTHAVPAGAPIQTAQAMRAAELAVAAAGISLSELMERAGAAVADLAWRVAAGREILILCGPGNNGGDGYAAARLLQERGAAVRIAASGPPRSELAQAAAARWRRGIEPLADAAGAPIIIDALFGTGLDRPLPDDIAAPLRRLAASAQRVIAVDSPSGVGTDDGALLGAPLQADITLALGALKPAHVLLPSAPVCGKVLVADIGIATESKLRTLAPPVLRPPGPADHKYRRGMVGVIAGRMGGAAALAAQAAARAGAGYVTLYDGRTDRLPQSIVRKRLSDGLDRRLNAIVIGPGLGDGERAEQAIAAARAAAVPIVLDADALASWDREWLAPAILTPHEGEFERLAADLAGSKVVCTRALAAQTGHVILHKGADGIIAAPDGRAVACWPGSPWLASAGTGDVLAGLCGAMLARGLPPFEAACAATWLHIRAAKAIGPGLIADDLVHKGFAD